MVREVSEFHEYLETEPGCNLTHFQVLHKCEAGDLHDLYRQKNYTDIS